MNIGAGELHLYTADLNEFDAAALAQSCSDWLDGAEQKRLKRYHLQRHRQRFLLSRLLLRKTLSRYADLTPPDWRFTENEHGRPAVRAELIRAPLHFNLSHSGSRLALVLGRESLLGVDVEYCARPRRLAKIADRYFAPAEVEALLKLPADQRLTRFYQLWTLKEAYIKAHGLGLLMGLHRFSFDFPGDREIALSTSPELQDEPAAWQFWQFHLGPDYQAALALRAQSKAVFTVQHRRISDLHSAITEPLVIDRRKRPG